MQARDGVGGGEGWGGGLSVGNKETQHLHKIHNAMLVVGGVCRCVGRCLLKTKQRRGNMRGGRKEGRNRKSLLKPPFSES